MSHARGHIERITAAALRLPSGEVISVEAPLRHHDVIRYMRSVGHTPGEISQCESGFISSAGRFYGRASALDVALAADQIGIVREKTHPEHELFSEDLW